jgi:hypothetical protein
VNCTATLATRAIKETTVAVEATTDNKTGPPQRERAKIVIPAGSSSGTVEIRISWTGTAQITASLQGTKKTVTITMDP